jgi:DUF1680 family protein
MPVERVHAHPAVRQDVGQVALQRGPLVYCLEGVDNPFPLDRLLVPSAAALTAQHQPQLLGGISVVSGPAVLEDEADWRGRLYRESSARLLPVTFRAVPYYAWDHRAAGEMRVYVRDAE